MLLPSAALAAITNSDGTSAMQVYKGPNGNVECAAMVGDDLFTCAFTLSPSDDMSMLMEQMPRYLAVDAEVADDEEVKTFIHQCAFIGFEVMIYAQEDIDLMDTAKNLGFAVASDEPLHHVKW